mgnify:CR=1 FL=1
MVNIKRNGNFEVDADRINKEALKIMVSENYEFGDPELAQWNPLDVANIPLVEDFNPHNTAKISLSEYANRKISIAFLLDLSQVDIGGHGLLWQINEFKLFGAKDNSADSEEALILERKDPTNYLYQKDFATGLAEYTQTQDSDTAAQFVSTERNGKTYVEISGFDAKNSGVSMLISPSIELFNLNYSIRIEQAINFYKPEAQERKYIRILIGIDKENLSEIEWEELVFEKAPAGNEWTPVVSEWKNINLKNTKIRIAFRYESGNGIPQYPNWNLFNLDIKEEE